MIDFDDIKNKDPNDIKQAIYKSLDMAGIEYEKGNGKIIFDGLPEITLEDFLKEIQNHP